MFKFQPQEKKVSNSVFLDFEVVSNFDIRDFEFPAFVWKGGTMDLIPRIRAYVNEQKDRFLNELITFLEQPGISTTGVGIDETVRYLFDELTRLGFQSRILTLENANPVVFGEGGDPSARVTLCIYGHYDVQAPDPLSEWHSDPFNPVIRNGLIYARGATDDKGNLLANVKAAEIFLALFERLPLRLKFLFEGEEEIGSPNLRRYLETYRTF